MKRRRIGAAAARCAGTLNLFEDLEQPGCAAPAAGPPSDDPDERTEPDPDPSPLAVDRAVEAAGLRAEALSRGSGPDRFRGEPLSPHAAAVTASADVAGRRLRLPGTLPRDVYEELAEAFKRIGGRWVRRGSKREDGAPAGFFEFPEESEDLVQAVITTGRKPPKNPTSLFPSPPEVVDRIIELADLGAATLAGEYRFLEPHAGRGAIADRIRALFPTCPLDLIEILDLNLHVLRRKGYAPIAGDFLHFDPGPVYDRILANPPFSLSGAPLAYQEHIRHAWQLLSSRGILVSVIPAYIPRAGSDARAFERWIADRGEIEELPAGSFRSSGTNVATGLICLDKRSAGWKRQPFCGWGSWHGWQTALWAENTRSLYDVELRLYDEIDSGAFGRDPAPSGTPVWALAGAVRNYYARAADQLNRSPLNAGVFPSDNDFHELIAHFIARYREHREYAEQWHRREARAA